ncbi:MULTISPECIES: hypothetical protein [Cyanophyceae]|uniref:Uncharacterized protein n=1 Tax=Leptolyngbya subtilissima DQ-A4 TaxID=2933933 RepID=A0ABV0KCY5_9CYAN|nr:hypothetical protein [Nodosilinea sp. FACHB-141]MBD2113730.1 hypothetical protein [Nodosilinea sp. FACHB-141]
MAISFNRAADFYDNTRTLAPEVSERLTVEILRLGQATPDTTFLESGIGTGQIALLMVKLDYAYARVIFQRRQWTSSSKRLRAKPID